MSLGRMGLRLDLGIEIGVEVSGFSESDGGSRTRSIGYRFCVFRV